MEQKHTKGYTEFDKETYFGNNTLGYNYTRQSSAFFENSVSDLWDLIYHLIPRAEFWSCEQNWFRKVFIFSFVFFISSIFL